MNVFTKLTFSIIDAPRYLSIYSSNYYCTSIIFYDIKKDEKKLFTTSSQLMPPWLMSALMLHYVFGFLLCLFSYL